jgi:hypothetical protein
MKVKNAGFISISREIKNHWITENPIYFKAWVLMLLTANFTDGKLLLGGKVYTIKRGQTSLSLRSWANELNMSVKSIDTMLKLLVSEDMIKREKIGSGKQSTTLITIKNYNTYQLFTETLEKRKGNMRETLGEHKGNARGVQYNKVNKVNNDNKGIYRSFDHLSISVEDFEKLNQTYTKESIDDILDSIDNFKGNTKYKSLYLTANKWLKKDGVVKIEKKVDPRLGSAVSDSGMKF